MPYILLTDVVSEDSDSELRGFKPSCCFPTVIFFFFFCLAVAGSSEEVSWISSESDKIWMGWSKSEGFSLFGKRSGSD